MVQLDRVFPRRADHPPGAGRGSVTTRTRSSEGMTALGTHIMDKLNTATVKYGHAQVSVTLIIIKSSCLIRVIHKNFSKYTNGSVRKSSIIGGTPFTMVHPTNSIQVKLIFRNQTNSVTCVLS